MTHCDAKIDEREQPVSRSLLGLCALVIAIGGAGCGGTLVDHRANPRLLTLVCAPELVACDGRCLSCSAPANAHGVCTAGACDFECEEGFNRCSPNACVAESPASCGPACADCSATLPANASAVCSAAHSCDFECHPGYLRSGDTCQRAVALSAGFNHTCALTADGRAKCWGANEQGQLGVGDREYRYTPADVPLPGPASWISAGYYHSCAVVNQELYCWGDNAFGEIGDGTYVDRLSPVRVPGLSQVVSVTAGGCGTDVAGTSFGHTCAILAGGALQCWGSNGSGQLGDGTRRTRASPAPVTVLPGGAVVSAVAVGERHTCALAADQVYCWGANDSGQLGIPGAQTTPATPTIASGAWMVATGQNHGCALVGTDVKCWGLNNSWQVDPDDQATSDPLDAPTIPGIGPLEPTTMAAGRAFTCVVDGHVTPATTRCFGDDTAGQLGGPGKLADPDVLAPSTVRAISAGANHACVLTGEGGVQCWGANDEGQLGNPAQGDDSWTPAYVSGR